MFGSVAVAVTCCPVEVAVVVVTAILVIAAMSGFSKGFAELGSKVLLLCVLSQRCTRDIV